MKDEAEPGRESIDAVPFISILPNDRPPQALIYAALEQYRAEADNILKGLGKTIEIVRRHEPKTSTYSYADAIQTKINRLAACFDHDEAVLHNLTITVPMQHDAMITLALPTESDHDNDDNEDADDDDYAFVGPSTVFSKKATSNNGGDNHAYDSITQLVAHIARDWSSIGEPIRENLYGWCREQLQTHGVIAAPVLVPGAGLGRLAVELLQCGAPVEANELSIVMASASYTILNQHIAHGTIHPYVMDYFRNEVDAQRRYDVVTFPDIFPNSTAGLSYTIGDFVSSYYSMTRARSYGAVVTCFFLDTATNVLEYLDVIHRLLVDGGVWINVGPVQWHQYATVTPSVDELKHLIQHTFGFRIVHFSVDSDPISYRDMDLHEPSPQQGDSFTRTTNYEGYRPLRFVAIRE